MLIIDYKKEHHSKIIHSCVLALRSGKVIAYPTDTSYGLAVDATNIAAIKKLYKVKGRDFNKPVHIIPPKISAAKKIVHWDKVAERLAKKFFPGALTLVVEVRVKRLELRVLTANTGFLGIRMPKNDIALDLAKVLNKPITTTSSNLSGMPDCYSADDILKQFKKQKFTPDIIINAGKLPKRKPSTVVKIQDNQITILRPGPISEKQIKKLL